MVGLEAYIAQRILGVVPASYRINNNNNKRPLTPKSMPPAGDERAKLKT